MKRTNLLYFVITAVAVILMSACTARKNGENRLCLEFYKYDTLSQLSDTDSLSDDDAKYWRSIGEGVLPDASGNPDLKVLRDTLEQMGYVTYVDGTHASPRSAKGMELTDIDPASVTAGNYSVNILSLRYMSPNLAVWKDELEYYLAGAAHGRTQSRYLNYDIPANRVILLSDLFRNGYEKPLLAELKERLKENPEVFEDADIYIPDNFFISEQGITFVYDVYAVAPFSAGEIEVSFAPYELNELLTPKASALLDAPMPD